MADNEQMSGQTDGATVQDAGSGLAPPVEFDVEVKLMDPNSPLYSIKSFAELGLSGDILKGLYKLNFRAPSKIQEKALPMLLGNPPMNMIGQSQSGTGKTAAFSLNILSRLDLSTEVAQKTPQALVLAPTRELARQIIGVLNSIGEFVPNLKVSAAIPMDQGQRVTTLDGQIVVGTPGTTSDLIKKRILNPTHIKTLVLDEADNMLDQAGLGEQCLRVKILLPKQIQIVLFSATFPDKVKEFASKFAPNANEMHLKQEELTVEGIKQIYMDCSSEEHKYEVLTKLYGLMTIGSSIIFVKRRDTAVQVERRMIEQGHKVVSLTGAYEPSIRDTIIDAFRTGAAKVLITTNVLARGIDVASVNLVINYDIPDDGQRPPRADPQTYLHRIGRTGRYGRIGAAISFIHDKNSFNLMNEIATYFNVQPQRMPTDDWDYVEEQLSRILKSKAAAADFKPEYQEDRKGPSSQSDQMM